MVDVISSVGLCYKLPKYNQLRVNLMGDAKNEVLFLLIVTELLRENGVALLWLMVGRIDQK